MQPNCCLDLDDTVKWFTELKNDGVSEEDILDILEFDGDQYPDFNILLKAKMLVYK